MAQHFEDDRSAFQRLGERFDKQNDAVTKWFIGLGTTLVLIFGGVIANLLKH